MELTKDNRKKYWDGPKNRIVRYYFYVQNGLALLNEFRYLLMAIFALYYALKIDNIAIVPAMFVVALPVLIFLGWMSIHHMEKTMEYLRVQYATHFSRYNIELQERQTKAIEEMLNEIQTLRQKVDNLVP